MTSLETYQATSREAELAAETRISILEIFRSFRRRWRITAVTTGTLLVFALLYVHIATPIYQSQVVVYPVSSNAAPSGLSSLASLGSLAGINLNFGSTSDFNEYITLLQSRKLSDQLAKEPGILQGVFSNYWDPDAKQWRGPSGVTGAVISFIKSVLGLPAWRPPTGEDLAAYLQYNLEIDVPSDSSKVVLVYNNPDPKFAARFVTALSREADNILREEMRADSIQRVKYISEKLKETTLSDARNVLIGLLAAEEQKLMLVNADRYYAAAVVDPAAVATLPRWPRPAVLLVLAVVFGFVISFFITAMKDWDRWSDLNAVPEEDFAEPIHARGPGLMERLRGLAGQWRGKPSNFPDH